MNQQRSFFRTPGFVVLTTIFLLALLYASLQGHQGNAVHLWRADRHIYVSMQEFGQVVQYQVFAKDFASLPRQYKLRYLNIEKSFAFDDKAPVKALKMEKLSELSFPGSVVSSEMYSNTLFVVDELTGIYRYWKDKATELTQPDIPFYGAQDIAVTDGYTFVAGGEAGIFIYASPTPTATLAMTGHIETLGTAESLALITRLGLDTVQEEDFSSGRVKTVEVEKIVSRTLVVADGSGGVVILDVTNPQTPIPMVTISRHGYVHGVTVEGDLLYVAQGLQGWSILNIKDPGKYVEQIALDTRGDVRDVAVNDAFIAVADGNNGLLVYRNTNDPKKILPEPIVIDLPGFVSSVELVNNYALVADGVEGVRVIDLANPERWVIRASATTPGEYTLQQVWMNGSQPEGSPEHAKVILSLEDLRNEAIMLAAGLLLTFLFVSIVTLPAYSPRYWLQRQRSHPVMVEGGQIVSPPETRHPERMRAIHIDSASAVAVVGPNNQRMLGPGLAFLQPRERPGRTIDLRPNLVISGPTFTEDPFAGEMAGETGQQRLARLVRRAQTEGKTRDDKTAVPNFLVDVRVKAEPGEGGSSYGYSPINAQLAMLPELEAYEQMLPHMSPAVGWYELVTQLATQLWVQYLGKFTLQELFTPLPDSPDTFPAEVSTGLQRVAWMMQRHLTEPLAPSLDENGTPTGQMMQSAEFAALQQRGLIVRRLQVINLRLEPAVWDALKNSWLAEWNANAQLELLVTQEQLAEALALATQAARTRFLNIVDLPRQNLQALAGATPLQPVQTLISWVQGTRNLSELTPEMRQQLDDLRAILEGWT